MVFGVDAHLSSKQDDNFSDLLSFSLVNHFINTPNHLLNNLVFQLVIRFVYELLDEVAESAVVISNKLRKGVPKLLLHLVLLLVIHVGHPLNLCLPVVIDIVNLVERKKTKQYALHHFGVIQLTLGHELLELVHELDGNRSCL